MNLIDKDVVIAEIERRMQCYSSEGCEPNTGKWVELISIKHFIDTLEVKGADLEKVFNDEYSKFSNDPDAMDYAFPIDLADYKDFAKHFFELGISINYPITASDKGIAEEIILNLEKIEKDYNLCLIKEKEWINKQIQKGE